MVRRSLEGNMAAAVIFFLAALPVAARDFSLIDAAIADMPRAGSVADVVSYINRNAADDWTRARGAYRWIVHNIAYDVDAFFRGTRPALDATGVFSTKKSVCQGYSELFAAIAKGLGLDVAVIEGYANAYAYRPGQRFTTTNHAWNVVKLGGAWRLVDCTWGAGHVENTRFVPLPRNAWFDMDPRLFALNHFPRDSRWLLLEKPLSLPEFEQAPYVETYTLELLVEAGFTADECASLVAYAPLPVFFGNYASAFRSMGGRAADLTGYLSTGAMPEVHAYPGYQPRLVEYPRQSRLAAGTRYRFAFQLSGCDQAAVITGGSFVFLTREGDLFSGEATAAAGSVLLSAKIDHRSTLSFWPLMIWQAK